MSNGQRPFSELFPDLPDGFEEPFWYASLQSFWLYYRVEADLLRERLPAGAGLEVALFDFGAGERAGLASLDFQRYTGHGPQYLETTDEVEVNFYVYPQAREPLVPLMTWQQYLLGTDQTKTIGGYRLHVPCDNPIAVMAGRGLYGEPKYLAVFDYKVPSLNGNPTPVWQYQVFQDLGGPPDPPDPHTPVKGPLIYRIDCDLTGVAAQPASASPLIEYGVLDGNLVANFWDFYGQFDTYMGPSAQLTLGTEADPTGTLDDVRTLIGASQPIAAQVYTSAPVSAEQRGWFQVPVARPAKPAASFAALSSALTGYREAELWGTGMVEPYLDALYATVGETIVTRLLATGDEALRTGRLKALVLDDPDLGPVARNTIILWYLGQWNALPGEWRTRNGASPLDVPRVISADAYAAGLVWRTIGAHPMGADPPGYGEWANPPGHD